MVWDESKHPRKPAGCAGGGQFVEKISSDSKNSELEKAKRIYDSEYPCPSVRLPFNFFGNKDKKESLKEIPPIPKGIYGFYRIETKHHDAHRKAMGYKDFKQYEKAAINFWKKGEGKVYFGNDRKFCKYNERTKEYVVITPDGFVKTYYLCEHSNFMKVKVQKRLYEITI